ncbi:Pantoate kinase [Halalkaliarchaeum sp. AArc-CO]|uniref:pantoate kinase n=1 Tax=unclassified Halalkaliarchaeum TaxID=2678344 RepID=UPI00217D6716|nr:MULTISPECIES: pantoate kinase [unclassified Halalkaliarchaeum]MDR5673534.1 pantoate kinase [Halalkaliarchaeum sp. AArc-GB]UWG49779.1 Pantoate kinase [Halalkaliarchaeum sp. AArc-CO]
MTRPTASTAFAPGHVTAFFSIHRGESPSASGSRGAGLALSEGVTATVRPAADKNERKTQIRLNGTRVTIEAVEHVLAELGVTARVRLETPLPPGAGFGVSGAAALATALSANHEFGCGRTENELVGIAHAADVEAGTGLGDVVAQARGGIPIRVEPGAPGYGSLDGIPDCRRVEYVTFGELSTPDVLSGETEALSAAGECALTGLLDDPTVETLLAEGRRFTREIGVAAPEVAEAIDAVDDAGGEASMAMLGRSVFALGTGLTDAGYDPTICRTHSAGATLEPE